MVDPLDFLSSVFGGDKPVAAPFSWRPYVTLTFAQSLDAKIAGVNGKQLILSGQESMVMTHWMRTMHDGILIGIGTALNDDPQLNTRHLPESAGVHSKPRPIIMDTNLRLSSDCKLLKNYREGKGRRPWVLCSDVLEDCGRWQELETAGARMIPIGPLSSAGLAITPVLTTLRTLGIETLMVEGGAKVIASFLGGASSSKLVDAMVLTIAPVLTGKEGTGYDVTGVDSIEVVRTVRLGRDTVVGLKVR